MGGWRFVVAAAAVACAPLGAQAQNQQVEAPAAEGEPRLAPVEAGEPAAAPVSEASAPPGDAPAAQASRAVSTIPALTPVEVEILVELSSKTSLKGETFPLRLAAPVVIDGVELLPAGTPGLGEVIHAKKSGGGGTGGELVLAARYLEVGDARLPLRSLRFDATARERMRTVEAINMASAAVLPAASFLGFLIKGDQMSLASGSILSAKTAADFAIEIAAASDDPTGEASIAAAAEAGEPIAAATVEATPSISATGEDSQ